MPEFARVTSIEALRQFKAALADFAEHAGLALSEAQSDVQRTIAWLIYSGTLRDAKLDALTLLSSRVSERKGSACSGPAR